MAQIGSITIACPVCGEDFVAKLTAGIVGRNHEPGQGTVSIKVKTPIRVPTAHRSCFSKVVG